MDIRSLIITSIALTACKEKMEFEVSGGDCPNQEFELDQDIEAQALQNLLEAEDELDLSCEELCTEINLLDGNEVTVLSCEHSLDFTELPADFFDWDPSEVVGSISCSGEITQYCMGRRPLGHVEATRSIRDLGSHFACAAHLEAASVTAFLELAGQLHSWGAPRELVVRCMAAARDEALHTRLFQRLARDCGAEMEQPETEETPTDLLNVAKHNATEGCVNETWAALEAAYLALHCKHPVLRKVYRRIAVDETKHGQLAWDIHRWMMTQLSAEEQVDVLSVQTEALRRLRAIVEGGEHPMLQEPDPVHKAAMLEAFIKGMAA